MAKIEGVIFDMDGTLTVPILDFNLIRAEIGIESGPVWEAILAMSDADRKRAEGILLHYELLAARECEIQPGAIKLFDELEQRGIEVSVLTRNCRAAWVTLQQRFGFPFDRVYAREDGPMKPAPEPVFSLAKAMELPTNKLLCVGDYLFDIQAGKSAGTETALIVHSDDLPSYADQADYVIRSLLEILPIIDES